MTNYPYIAPCSNFLVRSYEIPRSVDHVVIFRSGNECAQRGKFTGNGFQRNCELHGNDIISV